MVYNRKGGQEDRIVLIASEGNLETLHMFRTQVGLGVSVTGISKSDLN